MVFVDGQGILLLVLRGLVREPVIRTVLIVGLVGVLLGVAAVLRSPVPLPEDDGSAAPAEKRPAFASSFVHFFPGRTPDGSRPRAGSALVRASKFLAGERVGLRVQTVPDLRASVTVEVRFLTRDTREELPTLLDDRQTFRIRRGLRTYCCLKIPHESGEYVIALLVEGQYLAFFPATVKEGPQQGEGGLFVPVEE